MHFIKIAEATNLRIQIINFFNCIFNIPWLYCFLDSHTICNSCKIYICYLSIRKFIKESERIWIIALTLQTTQRRDEKDTFCARFCSEFLCCIHISLGHKKVHNQLVHVFFSNFNIIKLFLPLVSCYYLLWSSLHMIILW